MLPVLVAQVFWSVAALAQEATESIDTIRSAYDASIAKPLAERIPDLELLEQSIEQSLFEDRLDLRTRAAFLQYQYRTEVALAKYDESHNTFIEYVRALENGYDKDYSRTALRSKINTIAHAQEWAEVEALCQKVKEEYPDEADTKGFALYSMGAAKMRIAGRLSTAIPDFELLIQECPGHALRPWAFRMLANCQLSGGDMESCLGTLALLKQQYAGTHWEHYADMRQAYVYEQQRADAQKALEIYNASLERYPDHHYWAYIHKQIPRLHKVIEEQLIQDALEGLVKQQEEAPNAEENEDDAQHTLGLLK